MSRTIGKVSFETGCKIETIRFYEKKGLLPSPDRTEGGHRVYTSEIVDRLLFIRRCRDLGFAMSNVRELLSLVDGEHESCEPVQSILDEQLHQTRQKIADLTKMERTLLSLSKECSGGAVPDCKIISALQE